MFCQNLYPEIDIKINVVKTLNASISKVKSTLRNLLEKVVSNEEFKRMIEDNEKLQQRVDTSLS